jgi:RimJ/RimL family protein N-acetyltransferase
MDREVLTNRLRIRDWTADDLSALAEIFARPEVWRYPFGRGLSLEETEQYLSRKISGQEAGTASPSALEERSTGRILGYIALSPPEWLPEVMPAVEIGWRLDPCSWGKGLVTEGATALLAYGFRQMNLAEILSIYEPENVASGRVMQRIGMRFDRETVHPYFARPLYIYSVSLAEWEKTEDARRTPLPGG